jgi:transposase
MTPEGMTVLLAVEPADMRRSFDGLTLWVQTHLGRDAKATGTMYVFVNRRRDMAKVLWRDGTGWCLLSKRLDERTVALPANIPEGASSVTVDARTLAALLDGVVRRRSETAKSIARAARDAVEKARMTTNISENTVTSSTA